MLKINALITTLVIGTSSVAMADTTFSFNATAKASWGTPTVTAPIVRDHRKTTISFQQPATRLRGTWISLAEPMNFNRGRNTLDLSSTAQLNQIRLQSASGSAFIGTVTVYFVGGASQVVTLNQMIDARNPMAQFNLNRTAQVDAIMITNAKNQRAAGKLQVFGYASSTRPTPPVYQSEQPVYQAPVYQLPAYQAPVYQPTTPLSVPLANNITLWGTHGSKEIVVDNQRSFSTLRVTGTTGQSPMSHIIVAFTNGHQQTIPINRTQVPGENLDLTLDGAGRYNIARITVYHNGTSDLVGPTGYFNVTAL
jgi:hypothetical protein